MLGIITGDQTLLSEFELRLEQLPGAVARTTMGETVVMTARGEHESVQHHGSGCLIGLISSLPVPGHDVSQFATDLIEDYLRSGPEFIGDRPGQFSVVIWDPTSEELHLFRDRIGVPPLFYCSSDRGFAWSTSIKALPRLGQDSGVDDIALGQYQLTGYVLAPRTLYAGVRKIPAAHQLTYSAGEERLQRYWKPDWEPKHHNDPHEDSLEVEQLLTRAITQMAPRSGRLGLLLSSGVDSTGLAAVASTIDDLEVEAFTFTYRDYDGILNESETARSVADYLGFHHSEIEMGPGFVIENLPTLLRTYEEPFSYGLHSASMTPIAERGIEVVLTGAEGVTWALSRAWIRGIMLGRTVPRPILQGLRGVVAAVPGIPRKVETLLSIAAATDIQRVLAMSDQQLIGPHQAASLRSNPEVVRDAYEDLVRHLDFAIRDIGDLTSEDNLAMLDLASFGPDHLVWWSYRWAEAAGLSVRFPLLDLDYIRYMARKRRRDEAKTDRQDMAARHLPEVLANRQRTAQAAPLSDWLRGPLHDWARSILNRDEVVADGRLNWATVNRCLTEHRSGVADHRWCIWTSVSYLLWKREMLP